MDFVRAMEQCLESFSTGEERSMQPAVGIVNRPTGQKTLFRPFTSPSSVGTKIIVDPAIDASGNKPGLHGILAVCDNRGMPTGIMNAEEITGYRTSLSAIIPFMWRRCVNHIIVFGAGTQAIWHVRLALSLRGSEVDRITIINRSESRAQRLIDQVTEENEKFWKSRANLTYTSSASAGYEQRLTEILAEADVIFCTVPTQTPLFPVKLIAGNVKLRRQPLITAIGSWQTDMMEVDPDLVRHIVDDLEAYNPKGESGGAVIVDDRQGSLEHAGEIVHSQVDADHLLELGEILSWQKGGRVWPQQHPSEEGRKWLSEGLVIYKSIGVSVTDLATAEVILSLARQRKIGMMLSGL